MTPYAGYTVKVYRNLYENGKLKDTKLESTSVYRSRDKVVLVSPGGCRAVWTLIPAAERKNV